MKRILAAATIALVMGLICSLAYGEEANSNDNWEFGLAPMYLWAVSINGDQTVKGIDVDLDIPFSDIFDNLNGALIFHFEGLYQQKWGFFTDLNIIDLNPSESTPIGDIDIGFKETLWEVAGFYCIRRGAHSFNWLGGFRYSSMDISMDLPAFLPKIGGDEDWVDPFLGLRWQWKMGEKWVTILRGDIGGFGVGCDITWNFVGLVDFKPWKHVSLFGGYRLLYQDYSTGSGSSEFAFDATMQGPVLGMNIIW
jgi:hypothetical protein